MNYFAHWAPAVSRALLRECVLVLDALNAAVFALLCVERPGEIVGRSVVAAFTRRGEWRQFVAKLDQPQWLLTPVTDRDPRQGRTSTRS